MILIFALLFCVGTLFFASRLGRLPRASSATLLRVLRPLGLVVAVSVAFGILIGFAGAKREISGQAWRQIREARQRLDPKSKTSDPDYWKQQLTEGEAKLKASEGAGVEGTVVGKGVIRTTSIALFLAGFLGSLALLRFRAEQ